MILQHNTQVNRTTYAKGTEFRAVAMQRDGYTGRNCFLLQALNGEHAGGQFWSGDVRHLFKPYKCPVNNFLFYAVEYLAAGWSADRIAGAGLLPSECLPHWPQFVKYWRELATAPAL